MKYLLKPVEADFIVRTTTLCFQVNERAPLPVILEVAVANRETQNEEYNDTIKKAIITFPIVAKLEHTMLNFWENNYNDFEILNNTKDNLGFYHVINPAWDQSLFDPLQRLALSHFLIVGYDSYLEVLASSNFNVSFLES